MSDLRRLTSRLMVARDAKLLSARLALKQTELRAHASDGGFTGIGTKA